MGLDKTLPAPAAPNSTRQHGARGAHTRSLRTRWRLHMILGMNLLAGVVLVGAVLITFVDQRHNVTRLHETTADQAHAAITQRLDSLQSALIAAKTGPEMEVLLQSEPGLRAISRVGADGFEVERVPARDGAVPNWLASAAWLVSLRGDVYLGSLPDAPDALGLAVRDGTGVVVAELDPTGLWGAVVSTKMGDRGYLFLMDDSGVLLLADDAAVDIDADADPADFPSFTVARDDRPDYRVYQGLEGRWVVGRAERVTGPLYVVTETPLREFLPPVVRLLALAALVLALNVIIGETLISRILNTVVAPVDILTQGAEAVGGGDYRYHIRLPPNTDREMLQLGHAFNEMIARLQESQRQIDAYAHEMEAIVDQRARELSRKAMQLEVAAEVSSKIATLLDPKELIQQVVRLIRERFQVYRVAVLRVSADGLITLGSDSGLEALPPLSIREDASSVVAWSARHAQTLYVPDVREDPRYQPLPEYPATRCELAIPLQFGGRVIGVLNLEAEHRDAFARDDIAVLESLANEIAVSIHNAEVFAALENANRELADAMLQANQANRLKSRFLMNASHKLR
ncbi:MAG: GAF domain-containing protein, partial [Chloroflexi bacterium]|nr:GAF domain-containing protein [Chloroflexota bacterium]